MFAVEPMKSADTVVRSSTKDDLESIASHYGPLDNLGDPFCQPSTTQKVRLEWLVIAEIGGEYAGFLYWHLGQKPFFAPEIARFAHIREVQVLEKFQGRGIGRKLVNHAIARLRALAVTDVFLSTAENNDAAKHLYESVGFREFRKQIQYRLALDSTHSSLCQVR